jgi:D-alanyl-D-alanine carboxypeptidase
MITRRARSLFTRAVFARAVFARAVVVVVMVVLAGLVVPQVWPVAAHAAAPAGDTLLRSDLRADLADYLRARGAAEHISAAALSVSPAGRRSSIDVSAGTTTFGGSQEVRTSSVWQIGSNTKAFTSVLLLQLEAEGRLSIDDPLGRFLPQYPRWHDVTIRRLLNMTSGIATYDAQPAWQADFSAHPRQFFSPARLVDYVATAPPTTGYSYSNTNYVLAEMIIERVTGHSYRQELQERIIGPLHLRDLYYRADVYPASVTAREPAGYFFNSGDAGLSALMGRDVSRDSLSWARGAGGIIATTSDMTVWERALYTGRLLPPRQEAELMSLVSAKTGKPIARTSPADPMGFGLGIAQITVEPLGTVWFYEGETLGFRTLHVYLPRSGLIMAMGLNSQPADDKIGALVVAVYKTLVGHGVLPPA